VLLEDRRQLTGLVPPAPEAVEAIDLRVQSVPPGVCRDGPTWSTADDEAADASLPQRLQRGQGVGEGRLDEDRGGLVRLELRDERRIRRMFGGHLGGLRGEVHAGAVPVAALGLGHRDVVVSAQQGRPRCA